MKNEKTLIITVVTVCYNAEKTIRKTIQSVVSQTYSNIEYIIIDGASTDSTLTIINEYRDKISHIVTGPDTGIYNAMNKSFKYLSGDIIYFLNAGDYLATSNIIELVAKVFAQQTDCMLLYGNYSRIRKTGELHEIKQSFQLTPFKLWLMGICHQTIFARIGLYFEVGTFDEDLSVVADWDWLLRAFNVKIFKYSHIEKNICYYLDGGFSSHRSILAMERKKLHLKYFSQKQKILFCFCEVILKILTRVKSLNFSMPWVIRGRS